jgi:hypothetical protein
MKVSIPFIVIWALSAACSNDIGPTAGVLDVSLSSPHDDDGAVLFSVFGGPVDSVESAGFPVYSAHASADTVKLIVTGSLGSGAIARIHIPDLRQASHYGARVGQVAARLTYAPYDPAGYSVTLSP